MENGWEKRQRFEKDDNLFGVIFMLTIPAVIGLITILSLKGWDQFFGGTAIGAIYIVVLAEVLHVTCGIFNSVFKALGIESLVFEQD